MDAEGAGISGSGGAVNAKVHGSALFLCTQRKREKKKLQQGQALLFSFSFWLFAALLGWVCALFSSAPTRLHK